MKYGNTAFKWGTLFYGFKPQQIEINWKKSVLMASSRISKSGVMSLVLERVEAITMKINKPGTPAGGEMRSHRGPKKLNETFN